MKTINEVSTKLKTVLDAWFTKQCKNLDRDYYLYIVPQTATKPSTLTILSGHPAGNHILVRRVGKAVLAALNGTDVAFIDDDLDSLRIYRFNDSTWSLVDSGLIISNERLRKHLTIEQNHSVLMDLLRQMPCLTID